MIDYSIELFEEILPEAEEMFHNHASETELYNDQMPLNPDYGIYISLSKADRLFFVVARDDSDKIVGYLSLMLDKHPHHKDIMSCTNNLMYVSKEHRGENVAAKMFEVAEGLLKSLGVKHFMFMAKAANPLESLANHLGFDKCEVVYSKYIGEEK